MSQRGRHDQRGIDRAPDFPARRSIMALRRELGEKETPGLSYLIWIDPAGWRAT